MNLSFEDPELDGLARRLADITGETVEVAVCESVKLRLEQQERARARTATARVGKASVEEMLAIGRRIAALPVVDPRSPDEIMGYDEHGLPT